MNNMDILKAIPSKDVADYVLGNNWQFTDMQKAVIIYHSLLPLSERMKMLCKLETETENLDLKEQIAAYLAYGNL